MEKRSLKLVYILIINLKSVKFIKQQLFSEVMTFSKDIKQLTLFGVSRAFCLDVLDDLVSSRFLGHQ